MVCVWCSLGVTIYVLLTYVHGFISCILTGSHVFPLALGLDQMIWSWVVFVSLTKFMKQQHGKNEEKSEKVWNKIMAIMNQSYLAMKHCPSMHSVFESSVRASFKVSLSFWSFLSLPSRSWTTLVSLMSCCTLAQLSLTGASEIAFGNAEDEVTTAGVEEALLPLPLPPLPPQLAPVPNWLRHELTHLRTLILGEVGLATMQDHGRAQWLWLLFWHDSNHLSDRHHLVFPASFKACWFPWILSTT